MDMQTTGDVLEQVFDDEDSVADVDYGQNHSVVRSVALL